MVYCTYMKYVMYTLIGIALIAGIASTILNRMSPSLTTDIATTTAPSEEIACTMDAMMCPDGSYVGRTGPNCEFVCPPVPEVPTDVQAQIDAKTNLIRLTTPVPNAVVNAPLILTGEARGGWFFEASFPVTLVNWDGLIIAEGVATAQGEWMTAEFVPFTATLEYTSPYNDGDPDFMKRGAIILKKYNPSGLPENDDALEIPIRFVP